MEREKVVFSFLSKLVDVVKLNCRKAKLFSFFISFGDMFPSTYVESQRVGEVHVWRDR